MEPIISNKQLSQIIKKQVAELQFKADVTNPIRHIQICGDAGCCAVKAKEVLSTLQDLINSDEKVKAKTVIETVGCFGLCSQGPFIKILPDNVIYKTIKVKDVEEIFTSHLCNNQIVERLLFVNEEGNKVTKAEDITFINKQVKVALDGISSIDPLSLDDALGIHTYEALGKVITSLTSQDVVNLILMAGLRGRGGGGYLSGKKFQTVLDSNAKTKYVICNADEGDPDAYMDHSILFGKPHTILEAMAIAGYACGASEGIIFIKVQHPNVIEKLKKSIEDAKEAHLLGDNILGTNFSFNISIRLSAGAFICGEETALIKSIEGKRPTPSQRPPYPTTKGLWGCPSVVNNVETLANIPWIIRNGAAEYFKYGTYRTHGTKVFTLAGKVKNAGLVEIPMGTKVRDLIYTIGGGITNNKTFKCVQFGGSLGGCLSAKDLDLEIDFDNLASAGSLIGSGAISVMDENNCVVSMVKFYLDFIIQQSCGKCSPCRVGLNKMADIVTNITKGIGTSKDLDELETLALYIKDASLCNLGKNAVNPLLSTLRDFKDEYLAHIQEKKCPAGVCKDLITINIDPNKCKKCSLCSRACPLSAITGVLGKEPYVIDHAKCSKCGTCVATCRFGAISRR
jgi:NADH:ubiquinone oxidoreductase subunit F (NADH-binding)/(2Fe-2S) ferredoxin/Pyruvate/2-oxoacid:ferredoxin oxidoreductase delta subunit